MTNELPLGMTDELTLGMTEALLKTLAYPAREMQRGVVPAMGGSGARDDEVGRGPRPRGPRGRAAGLAQVFQCALAPRLHAAAAVRDARRAPDAARRLPRAGRGPRRVGRAAPGARAAEGAALLDALLRGAP